MTSDVMTIDDALPRHVPYFRLDKTHKQSGRCRTVGSVARARCTPDNMTNAICDFWTMRDRSVPDDWRMVLLRRDRYRSSRAYV